MANYTITRDYQQAVTLGTLTDANGNELCKTLELPWANNEQGVSCIFEGDYKIQKIYSARLGWCYRFQNVPGRSLVDMHKGNTVLDIEGCVLVGDAFGTFEIKGKAYQGVTNSATTLANLFKIIGSDGMITITSPKEVTT